MGSQHLEEELGRLSGQLQGLAPALEHMEERERETVAKIATLQEKVNGIQSNLKELVQKISERLKGIYTRLGQLETLMNGHVTAIADIQKGHDNVGKKIWRIAEIVITIVLTIIATKYFGGGGKS